MSAPVQNNPQTRGRSRIVVNLDNAPAGTPYSPQGQQLYGMRKRKRWPIVLSIIGGVLLCLVIVALIYWQYYKTKPAYSLALAINAAQRDDAAAFDEVFDTEQIVGSFTPQVIDEASARMGTGLTPAMRQRIEAIVPTLISNTKETVRSEVMKKVREAARRAEGKPFFILALFIPYVADIKQEGDNALVTAKVGERNIELTMQRNDKRWKIVAVKDDTLAKRIVDDLAKYLPPVGGDLIDEAGKEIRKRLPDILPSAPGAVERKRHR
jgi:hypothetical protein